MMASAGPGTYEARVLEAIVAKPTTPAETLFSRRAHPPIETGVDSILFPLKAETTTNEFIELIRNAQNAIFKITEATLGLTGKTWATKKERHAEKHFKRHKELHLATISSVTPGSLERHQRIKREQYAKGIIDQVSLLITALLSRLEITATVHECKLNPDDGHMIVRMKIEPQEEFLKFRTLIKKAFGEVIERYEEPERLTTLAAVIGVVDYTKFSDPSAKTAIETILANLKTSVAMLGPIRINSMQWVEAHKRTLSPKTRMLTREYKRHPSLEMPAALKGACLFLQWTNAEAIRQSSVISAKDIAETYAMN